MVRWLWDLLKRLWNMAISILLNNPTAYQPILGGALWSWGRNADAETGNSNVTDPKNPATAIAGHLFVKVSGGFAHGMGIKADGTLWAWGRNSEGQLGLGNLTSPTLGPTQVAASPAGDGKWLDCGCGVFHSVALDSDGLAYATGFNVQGESGHLAGNVTSFTAMTGSTVFASISAGSDGAGSRYGSIALTPSGEVWYTGRSDLGQGGVTGTNVAQMTKISTGSDVYTSAVTNGLTNLCLRNTGAAYANGYGGTGEIGDGLTNSSNTTLIAATGGHTFTKLIISWRGAYALKNDNTVWGWGNPVTNSFGAVVGQQNSPVQIQAGPYTDIGITTCNPGTNTTVFALKSDGTLWAWGSDSNQQRLGAGNGGTPVQLASPTTFTSLPSAMPATSGYALKD